MGKSKKDKFEYEQAKLMANLTLQMEKFCQVKEHFFAHKFNLTPAEFRCLRYIKDNTIMTTKELAQKMNLTPGRVTHLLNSIDKKKLINRTMDKNDRRSVQVTLTKEAKIFTDKVIAEYSNLHEEILKYLPASKRIEILNNMKFFFMALKDWAEEITE